MAKAECSLPKLYFLNPKHSVCSFTLFQPPPVATEEALENDKNCLQRDIRANVALSFSVFFAHLPFEMILLSLALVLFLLVKKKKKKGIFSSSNKTQWPDLNPEEDRRWSLLAFLCIFSGRD